MFTRRISGGIATVAHSNLGVDSGVRAYVLAEAREFRRQMVGSQLDDETWRDYVWKETSKMVDRLEAGQACSMHRYELPDSHPMRSLAHPSDYLELGSDDVVREL